MTARIETKLSVNLNKIALLRNQRDVGYPSVTEAARMVIAAGADGITVHPRPDERHVRVQDVHELGTLMAEAFDPVIEFNIEGYPTPDFIALLLKIKPAQATLVPDAPDQKTSDHGWDLDTDRAQLVEAMDFLKSSGIRVSLFMDPDPGAMAGVAAIGADRIELYTEPYAKAFGSADGDVMLRRYAETAEAATAAGLGINAGHDLNLDNLAPFHRALPGLAEVSIGHAITADALKMGLPAAVEAYLRALDRHRAEEG